MIPLQGDPKSRHLRCNPRTSFRTGLSARKSTICSAASSSLVHRWLLFRRLAGGGRGSWTDWSSRKESDRGATVDSPTSAAPESSSAGSRRTTPRPFSLKNPARPLTTPSSKRVRGSSSTSPSRTNHPLQGVVPSGRRCARRGRRVPQAGGTPGGPTPRSRYYPPAWYSKQEGWG